MDPAKTSKQRPTKPARAARRLKRNHARTDALLPAAPPDDMDAFRRAMARRITMFIGNNRGFWRNCQEPACRRTRGCVAPGGDCPQLPPLPPDPDGEREAQAVADFYKALKAEAARRGLDEDTSAPASHVPSSRRGRPRGSE
jgi:hypothetical protein